MIDVAPILGQVFLLLQVFMIDVIVSYVVITT